MESHVVTVEHNLPYGDFVGDCDCSSHCDVVKSKLHGETDVRKVECLTYPKENGSQVEKT